MRWRYPTRYASSLSIFLFDYALPTPALRGHPWRTLVAGDEQPYWPHGNQIKKRCTCSKKINFMD